jgi:hypothetical protein
MNGAQMTEPNKAQVTGQTASYARKTQKDLRKKMLKFQLISGCLLVAEAIDMAYLHQIILGVGFGIGFLIVYSMSGTLRKQIGQKRIGIESENLTLKMLRGSGALAIYNDLSLGYGGDLDHCVIYPNKIIAIETKTGFGEVRIVDGVVYSGKRAIPKNPIKQIQGQQEQLRRIIGVDAVPILCVSKMTNRPFRYNGVWVCSAKDLNRVISQISNFTNNLTAKQSINILNAIAQQKR